MGKETKAQATAHTLRDQIEQGIYEAGQKLPNENDLSLQLGISRTTLREAIRILVSQGHLQVRRGSGTFVSGPLNQTAETSLDMNDMKVTLRDLYEARLIFEPQAAALAARRASDEEIADILRLGEKVQKLIKQDPSGEARIASETAFHSAIIKALRIGAENRCELSVLDTESVISGKDPVALAGEFFEVRLVISRKIIRRGLPAREIAIVVQFFRNLIAGQAGESG